METAFPSKIADYLAAGKPILVFGPRYSSLVRYASEQGFAEIVDEFSPLLWRAVSRRSCSRLFIRKGWPLEHLRCSQPTMTFDASSRSSTLPSRESFVVPTTVPAVKALQTTTTDP